MPLLAAVTAVLVALASGAYIHRRLRTLAEEAGTRLSDDMIRRIEEDGVVHLEEDEPLDMEEIREEEERFWGESSWDDPEEM